MRIFGHRGAAGLALENSRESVLAGLKQDVAALEFDVHRTRDGYLVVIHDHYTGRVAEQNILIHDATLRELQAIKLNNGQAILTLDTLFTIIGSRTPVMVDIKDPGCVKQLVKLMDKHASVTVYVTSSLYDTLRQIRKARPDVPTYLLRDRNPLGMINKARRLQATGISLNMWLMNPLTYYFVKRHDLELLLYTVNNPWVMRFLEAFYPDATLYTDHPEHVPDRLRRA